MRDDKRNVFNSLVESFVCKVKAPKSDNNFFNQAVGAARNLGENYINMLNANYKSTPKMQEQGETIDNYYHCIGNYDAPKKGTWGSLTAGTIGLGREMLDYPKNIISKGKSFQQPADHFLNDMSINADGRNMAKKGDYISSLKACDKYRPTDYDPADRLRYYKK